MSGHRSNPAARPLNPAQIEARLEAFTPAGVALTSGVYTVVASWLVDSYGARSGILELTKTDGTKIRRRVSVRSNSTSGADATTVAIESQGSGTHANLAERDWLDADLSGTGTAQLARIKVKAGATGWTAIFYPDFLKAA